MRYFVLSTSVIYLLFIDNYQEKVPLFKKKENYGGELTSLKYFISLLTDNINRS